VGEPLPATYGRMISRPREPLRSRSTGNSRRFRCPRWQGSRAPTRWPTPPAA